MLQLSQSRNDPRFDGNFFPGRRPISCINGGHFLTAPVALLAGRREIAEIARFATTLNPKQRHLLGLPRKPGTKAFYQVPGYGVFYQLLTRMDPERFAALLSDWLNTHAASLPQALAMDGKMIRNHIGLLTLAQHEDGAPHAVEIFDQKEGTARCEQTAATKLFEKIPSLDEKIVTADALHCQKHTARLIVEKGGEYLLQIKANQPSLLTHAQLIDAATSTPFLSKPKPAMVGSKPVNSKPSPLSPPKSTSPLPAP